MPRADMAKLTREIDALEDLVTLALRGKIKDTDRRALRSEIEICVQRLDELRNRLSG
jgi:hypothetical protein